MSRIPIKSFTLTPAQRELVAAHADLAKKAAYVAMRRFAGFNSAKEDVLQGAWYGLCVAARRFDPAKKVFFTTYAYPWAIEYAKKAGKALHNAVSGTKRMVVFGSPAPKRGALLVKDLDPTIDQLEAENEDPDDRLAVHAAEKHVRRQLEQRLLAQKVKNARFKTRPARTSIAQEVDAFMRCSFGDETLEQVAIELGVTRERVRQIRNRIQPLFDDLALEMRAA
jgi:RNA polymerase sigma factor (sigma-70 family)